jgi:DNA-binding transcriptional regulator of glucitol operon
MGWQFPAILIGAMVLSIVLSLWQHRKYINVVNQMARENAGRQLRLVSGRAKGRLRGAIVVLLVDPAAGEIVDARAMIGATIFARLHPAPELIGPVAGLAERVGDNKKVRKAAEAALGMLPQRAGVPQAATPQTGRRAIRIPRAQSTPS